MAALTAAALVIFIIEAQIPLPIPIPGAKLGLANVITLFALFYSRSETQSKVTIKKTDAFAILVCRILLGALVTSRIIALLLSFAGGILGFAAQVLLMRFVTNKQIWVCGAIGAIFHNLGQIIAAIIVTGAPEIIFYLPVLTIIGIITGTTTGLIAQIVLTRINRHV